MEATKSIHYSLERYLNVFLSIPQMIAQELMTKEDVATVINEHTAYLNEQV